MACNLLVNSKYLAWNHPEKLGDLKNLRYKPTQSPLIPVVNCGPALFNVAKKSSGLKS